MIDILALVLTHGLMAIAAWRLLWRDDLDHEAGKDAATRSTRASRPAPQDVGQP